MIIAVSAIVIARLLGPETYGVYTLALVLPNILIFLLGLGVAIGVTRFSAQHLAMGEPAIAARMARNGLFFLVLFGAGLSALSFVGSGYISMVVLHRRSLTSLAQFASLAVFSQGVIQSVISALLGWNAMRAISVINVLQASLKLLVATALVILGFGVLGALTGLLASYFITGAFAVFSLLSVTGPSGLDGDRLRLFIHDNSTMLRYGFPHYAGSLVSGLALQYVTIVLAIVATNTVVGFYQSASNVLTAVSLTSSAVSLTLFPAFAHLEGIRANTALAFSYAVKYTSLLICPLILFLVGTSGPVIQILYGPSFSSANTYLVLLSLSNLPILLGYAIFPSFFSGVGRTRLSMYFFFLQASSQFVLAPLLGIWLGLGVRGLIYSIFFSNLAATTLGLYVGRRILGVSIDLKSLASILLASMVAFVAILPLQILSSSLVALVADTAVFAVVFLTSAPLLGAINTEDVVRLGIVTSELGVLSRVFTVILGYESRLLRMRFRG